MSDTPIYFLSTLPRSGSTLCACLLGQNPANHVTPTNGLLDLLVRIKDYWINDVSFKSQGLDNVQPRIVDTMRGMIRGFYAKEFEAGKTVFDKSRGWFQHVEMMEEVLQRPIRLITTVRSIEDVLASFEKIHRKSYLTKHPAVGPAFYDCQTTAGRAAQMLSKEAAVGLAINRLRDVITRGLRDRMLIIPYKVLSTRPLEVMDRLTKVLNLPPHTYDPNNVKQITIEDDTVHGMELHKIRSKVEPESKPAWADVLPPQLVQQIASEYSDINALAEGDLSF